MRRHSEHRTEPLEAANLITTSNIQCLGCDTGQDSWLLCASGFLICKMRPMRSIRQGERLKQSFPWPPLPGIGACPEVLGQEYICRHTPSAHPLPNSSTRACWATRTPLWGTPAPAKHKLELHLWPHPDLGEDWPCDLCRKPWQVLLLAHFTGRKAQHGVWEQASTWVVSLRYTVPRIQFRSLRETAPAPVCPAQTLYQALTPVTRGASYWTSPISQMRKLKSRKQRSSNLP